MKPMNIQELVAARIAAKREEDQAVANRRAIDEQIAAALATGKAEGTESRKFEELGVKVTVTYGVNRKVTSDEALSQAWDKLTADQQGAFKWKPSVSVTGLRKLEGSSLSTVSKFFETTPAAPSVKVELV